MNDRLNIEITAQQVVLAPFSDGGNHPRSSLYPMKSSISCAANLREMFREGTSLPAGQWTKAVVVMDSPITIFPSEEFSDDDLPTVFRHTISNCEATDIITQQIPALDVVAAFTVEKDIRTVIGDNFSEVTWTHTAVSMLESCYHRSFAGKGRKLYASFRDNRMTLVSLRSGRLVFFNRFDSLHSTDAMYFILQTWQQLGLDSETDELHLTGELPDSDLPKMLREFLANIVTMKTE